MSFLRYARTAARKPPRVVARRIAHELGAELERGRAPLRARKLDERALLGRLGARHAEELIERALASPFPAVTTTVDREAYERVTSGDGVRIHALAEQALRREVRVLGRTITVRAPTDWHTDPSTGTRWPLGYGRRLDYARLDEPCDVKVPWEVSRLQWLIPLGQAYLLDGDPRWAAGTRAIVEDWLAANPYSRGVNWAIAMEAALRAIVLAWLFHVFAPVWDERFSMRLLGSIYLHADFVDRNLELADVNGNHLDADAAALVVVGSLLGEEASPARWADRGGRLLADELPRQVTPDGVDFETATAYHRLVTELFALAASQRRLLGREVPGGYSDRLRAMAAFAQTYTRADGTTPLWGDADDARVLPFGGQEVTDHRYLPGLVACALGEEAPLAGPPAEICWLAGVERAERLASLPEPARQSRGFETGGVYVLQGTRDHLFVDAAPVGLAGRGGHGHNDALSFELVLDGARLVTDSGSFVYTADPRARDAFRSTAYHSTPQIDGEELNRFVTPPTLWSLHDDARPVVRDWAPDGRRPRLDAQHDGYRRLTQPVDVRRTFALDLDLHQLAVLDRFDGEGDHDVAVPLHLAAGVEAEVVDAACRVTTSGGEYAIAWAEGWAASLRDGWESPSYGVRLPRPVLELRRRGPLLDLAIAITRWADRPADPASFVSALTAQ